MQADAQKTAICVFPQGQKLKIRRTGMRCGPVRGGRTGPVRQMQHEYVFFTSMLHCGIIIMQVMQETAVRGRRINHKFKAENAFPAAENCSQCSQTDAGTRLAVERKGPSLRSEPSGSGTKRTVPAFQVRTVWKWNEKDRPCVPGGTKRTVPAFHER